MTYATLMKLQARFPQYAHSIAIIAIGTDIVDTEPQYDENGIQW